MDRTEWTITVLGLLGTFCMPWPDSSQMPQSDRPEIQRAAAGGCVLAGNARQVGAPVLASVQLER